MTTYTDFLETKKYAAPAVGFDIPADRLHPSLFGHQRDLTRWAIKRGRAALFKDAGLGKTRDQVEWCRIICEVTGGRALIVAPLIVVRQTVAEAALIGVTVTYARSQAEAAPTGITITNYERIAAFTLVTFVAIALDESSILKDESSKTRAHLTDACQEIPYRLCLSATPAPNDHAELANHAEFLGVMDRGQVLATFFVHAQERNADGTPKKGAKAQEWRLKGHARDAFYEWLSTWAMSMKRPSDLGYPDDGYILPPLGIHPVIVPTDWARPGEMFATELKGIGDRAAVRRATLHARVRVAADLLAADPDEPWIFWVGLNDEGYELAKLIPDCELVEGSQEPEAKAAAIERFMRGESRRLITKASIAAWGLNLQMCARMAFVGLSDSYEAYYQAVRRCWRFGQARPVHAYVVLTEPEEVIYTNVCRKQQDAEAMSAELVRRVIGFERAALAGYGRPEDMPHGQRTMLPSWLKGAA